MWTTGWREREWAEVSRPWDVIVVGGGITGAGVLHEAVQAGLRVLLVEADDFGAGTSSRSSKLVHGGLRYLKTGEIKLTFESVRERDRLLREGRGLVNQIACLIANYSGDRPPRWVFGLALIVYDILAGRWNHRHYDACDMLELAPGLNPRGLEGGYRFFDAQTDDARLVLRVIREAVALGGHALNYARVENLLRDKAGNACGVVLHDEADPARERVEVQARVVVNATGAWADELRRAVGGPRRLRPLRGSHLIFSAARLPVRRTLNFMHPEDQRPVFAIPWDGVVLCGTTDVDQGDNLVVDPVIHADEVNYLLDALNYAFPDLALAPGDVQATLSGVRPVINTGKTDPSRESREFVLWDERGLITVTGGKLTTFRLMAHQTLGAARRHLPAQPGPPKERRLLDEPPPVEAWAESALGLEPSLRWRLVGRYAAELPGLLAAAQPGELAPIAGSTALWAQLRWAARAEGVVHLDDLLLRRVRLGLLLPRGGLDQLEAIRAIVMPELGWDAARWACEAEAYARLWHAAYGPPAA